LPCAIVARTNGATWRTLGEAPRLARVHLGERQAGAGKNTLDAAVIGTGRLVDHARHLALAQPGEQGTVAAPVIGEAPRRPVRPAADVEMVLGDVHADGKLHRLFPVPCLSFGPQCPGIRSGLEEKTGAIKL